MLPFGISSTLFEYGLTLMCVSLLYTWVIGKGFFEKHMIEKSLIESRDKFEMINSNMNDIVWLFDLEPKLIFISKSSEMYFCATRDDLIKKDLKTLFPEGGAEDFANSFKQIKARSIQNLSSIIFNISHVCGENPSSWLEVAVSPVLKDNERLEGYLAVMRDITVRKNLEAELIQSQKLQAVGQLAAGVSHEFNNLLSVIILNTQIAQKKNTLPAYEKAMKTVIDASRQAETVAKRLNEFAKKHKLESRLTDIPSCVDEVITLISMECEKQNITIIREYEEVPKIVTDGRMLIQILFNIAKNAEQAIGVNGILTFKILVNENHLEVCIKDSGMGIKKENLKKIFDPFFSTKGAYGDGMVKGSGLGLSVSSSIIESLNGTILVESEEGHGSTFRICLPLRTKGKVIVENKKVENLNTPKFMKILVIDDDKEITAALKEMIDGLGHHTFVSNEPKKGLLLIDSLKPDLILLDIIMPNTDIVKYIGELKKHFNPAKIIMSTGIGTAEYVKMKEPLRKLGITKCLLKPYYMEDFKKMLNEVFEV